MQFGANGRLQEAAAALKPLLAFPCASTLVLTLHEVAGTDGAEVSGDGRRMDLSPAFQLTMRSPACSVRTLHLTVCEVQGQELNTICGLDNATCASLAASGIETVWLDLRACVPSPLVQQLTMAGIKVGGAQPDTNCTHAGLLQIRATPGGWTSYCVLVQSTWPVPAESHLPSRPG